MHATTPCVPSEAKGEGPHIKIRREEAKMTVAKVIRYKTRPEKADENERLIRRVFAELSSGEPEGLRYAAFRLGDGVTFLHVAIVDGDNPLLVSEAFGDFQSGIDERCEEGPFPADATLVGSYGVFAD
jgi:hypothetical protein